MVVCKAGAVSTVLVTGGAGFIGSHLVDAFVAAGDRVVVVDNLSSGSKANLADAIAGGATLHEIDVTDAASLLALAEQERPEVVIHLAAQIDVRVSVADPAWDAQINVIGTINTLQAALAAGSKRLVLASTGGAIYGDVETIPTPESTPALPLAPYGTSKLCAETFLALYSRTSGLSTVALRFANVYGPRQDSLGEAGVVAIFAGAALADKPLTIFGDGRQTRDYIYVGDVVAALVAAANNTVTGAINIGTGRETSVLDLALAVDAAVGRPTTTPQHHPARPGEVARSCLDPTLAAKLLGWAAEVALNDGITRTVGAMAAAEKQ